MLLQLAQNGAFLADQAVITERYVHGGTPSQQAHVAILTALDKLERQGFITFVPPEDWPDYVRSP